LRGLFDSECFRTNQQLPRRKGDNNTEFFHRVANGQRGKKTIISLQNGEEIIQGTEDLLRHATGFYKNLFEPHNSSNTRLRDDIWSEEEKLNDLDRRELDKEFTDEKIKKNDLPDGKEQSCWL
jgi:Skp family chaperone for outer membrane proteins